MNRVIVIGGGASGMLAAIFSANQNSNTILIDRMERVGRKLRITGKGRGNLTNIADVDEFMNNFPGNGRFLHSALNFFSNRDVMKFFENLGIELKIERGGRVFPKSDRAQDLVDALDSKLRDLNVEIHSKSRVIKILTESNRVTGVELHDGRKIFANRVILATGGKSYPATGSTGDGYELARYLGHSITPILPSLIPLETVEDFVKDLQGLTLKNVRAKFNRHEEFGEMLFTHFGISGPIILTLSRDVARSLSQKSPVTISIDLKPALTFDQLENRILRDFSKFRRKTIRNGLTELLPMKLIPIILDVAKIDSNLQVDQISQNSRRKLIETLKNFQLTIKSTRPIDEAIVTQGGIATKEINPKTMESKIIHGLFFAGEVIDIDGFTGGFNLQAAFSTGAVAGNFSGINNDRSEINDR